MSIRKVVYMLFWKIRAILGYFSTPYLIQIICSLIGILIFYLQVSWKLAYEFLKVIRLANSTYLTVTEVNFSNYRIVFTSYRCNQAVFSTIKLAHFL